MESALSPYQQRLAHERARPASSITYHFGLKCCCFLSSYLLWARPPDGIPGRLSRAIGLGCPRFLRQLSLLLPGRGPPRLTGTGAPGVLQKWVFQCLSCFCGSCWSSAPIRSQPASGPTPSLIPKRPESTVQVRNAPVPGSFTEYTVSLGHHVHSLSPCISLSFQVHKLYRRQTASYSSRFQSSPNTLRNANK